MEMEQPTAAQAAVATAASIQALAEALQANCAPAAASHRLVLSSFWKEDPVGWFHYAEAEFAISGYPADVLRALPPDVIAAVRDLVRVVTPETPGAYSCLKQSLLSRYTVQTADLNLPCIRRIPKMHSFIENKFMLQRFTLYDGIISAA